VDQGGLFSSKDFEYQLLQNKVEYSYEDMVLSAIFKHGNPVRLSELKNTFYSDLQPIYAAMYAEVVRLGLFPESPQSVRARNTGLGVLFWLLAGAAGVAAFLFGDILTQGLWMLPVAFGIVGLVWIITARAMPSKTEAGAEETAKWLAFQRYLAEMQRYTNVQAAAAKFQEYLPYAVAMNVEQQLTAQFANVPAAMPPYYMPYGYGPMYYPVGMPGHGGQQFGAGSSIGGQGGGMPGQFDPGGAMQGMSNSLAGAMQGMSNSFTDMVNAASSTLTSQPQSSGSGGGGGWGGGGGSFGGGGGGGGSAGAD
jgi:hypothetical protein